MRRSLQPRSLSVLMAVVLLVVGCTTLAPTRTPSSRPLTKVRILGLTYLSSSAFYIAVQEGYFAEQGIDAELITASPQQELLPLLIQGEVDVMYHQFNSGLLNAIASGADIKVVCAGTPSTDIGCATGGLLARKELLDSGALDDLSSVTQYRFALRAHSFPAYMTDRVLRSVNLSVDDLTLIPLETPIMGEALREGSIDIVWVGEPWTTRILQEGNAGLWIPSHSIYPGYTSGGVVFGPTLLGENRELGERFMVAFAKGFRQYVEGKTERNLQLVSEFTGLDEELLAQVCWETRAWDGQPYMPFVIDYQDWAVRSGLVDNPISEEQFWDPSFLAQALDVLGPAE
jgi:NitT/TauT family transport system substrate-binding protein